VGYEGKKEQQRGCHSSEIKVYTKIRTPTALNHEISIPDFWVVNFYMALKY
jgi:hypothetical protein